MNKTGDIVTYNTSTCNKKLEKLAYLTQIIAYTQYFDIVI
jgi:hypothetical protein